MYNVAFKWKKKRYFMRAGLGELFFLIFPQEIYYCDVNITNDVEEILV